MALTAEQAGLLQALAQIAVAFAGFAGVIGAFNRFATDVRVTAFRVRGMVALALFALLVTLAPLAVAGFGAGEDAVWRIATGFSAVLGVLLYAFLLREVLPLFRQRLLRTQVLNVLWYGLSAAALRCAPLPPAFVSQRPREVPGSRRLMISR